MSRAWAPEVVPVPDVVHERQIRAEVVGVAVPEAAAVDEDLDAALHAPLAGVVVSTAGVAFTVSPGAAATAGFSAAGIAPTTTGTENVRASVCTRVVSFAVTPM